MTPYQLGRAFLQGAFFGANWNANDNKTVWWLAQAPGPNIPTRPNPVAIGTIDATIVPSTNDWAASWKGIWNTAPGTTPTISGSTNGTGSSSSDGFPTPNSSNTTKDEGLSTSAKVGIAVGAVAVAAIGCAALFFLIRRHGAQKATPLKEEETRSPPPVPERGPSPEELDAPQGNAEMEADHYGRFAIKYNENSPVEML